MMISEKSQVGHEATGHVVASRNACRAFERNHVLPVSFLLQHVEALQAGSAHATTLHRLPDGTRFSITTNPDRTATEIRVLTEDHQ